MIEVSPLELLKFTVEALKRVCLHAHLIMDVCVVHVEVLLLTAKVRISGDDRHYSTIANH